MTWTRLFTICCRAWNALCLESIEKSVEILTTQKTKRTKCLQFQIRARWFQKNIWFQLRCIEKMSENPPNIWLAIFGEWNDYLRGPGLCTNERSSTWTCVKDAQTMYASKNLCLMSPSCTYMQAHAWIWYANARQSVLCKHSDVCVLTAMHMKEDHALPKARMSSTWR